jgi:hypothetical protein
MGYSGNVIDSTGLAQNTDMQTLLGRVSANVALNSDMATLLTRISAAVALNSDMATLLARVTAAVALNSDMATVLTRLASGTEIVSASNTSGLSNAFSAYTQLLATTSNPTKAILLRMSIRNTATTTATVQVQIATGGAGSEVVQHLEKVEVQASSTAQVAYSLPLAVNNPVRFAFNSASSDAAAAAVINLTFGRFN